MNRERKRLVLLSVVTMLFFCVGGYGVYRFLQHEKYQNAKISQLQGDVSLLKEELKLFTNREIVEYSDTAFNYLAIGNSITKHDICDYWWNEIGMAASIEDKDYVHLLSNSLENRHEDVFTYAYNFYIWEAQSTDRAETLELLEPYLDSMLNLVTIQLSENVSNMDTFEKDFAELVNYVHEKAPKAQIVIIDDFWDNGDKSIIKERIATEHGLQFVDLDEIKGKLSYQCGLGTIVYDADGSLHKVEHDGVAVHPGDLGMKYIADAVMETID